MQNYKIFNDKVLLYNEEILKKSKRKKPKQRMKMGYLPDSLSVISIFF